MTDWAGDQLWHKTQEPGGEKRDQVDSPLHFRSEFVSSSTATFSTYSPVYCCKGKMKKISTFLGLNLIFQVDTWNTEKQIQLCVEMRGRSQLRPESVEAQGFLKPKKINFNHGIVKKKMRKQKGRNRVLNYLNWDWEMISDHRCWGCGLWMVLSWQFLGKGRQALHRLTHSTRCCSEASKQGISITFATGWI